MFERVKRVVRSFLSGPQAQDNQTPTVIGKHQHRIDPLRVSEAAKKTCQILHSRGFEAYIVGGAVRDLLLGIEPKDFDVATNATPEQIKRCQKRAFIIGRRFRLVHVVFGIETIECSTFRALDAKGVRKDADGRVISDNVFGQMWEDAARRDFTINAMYYDPSSEEILDYHRGFEDIQARRLCMIGDPLERYREDPVRMMRAVRIASKLGFGMESRTEKAIPKMARFLDNVPAARLFDEMMKIFTCGHAESCLLQLRRDGLHRSLLPMLDVIFKEPEGEEFLLLALRRTDERIAVGKKISPAFLFATLLWPQVKKRWEAYEQNHGMPRARALFAAADDVSATQCSKIAIQNRFVADMKLIWMLQLHFERRTGKNPYALVQHPKYRAGYDFMLLRSLLGHVPAEQVRWWELFVEADEEERSALIREQEQLARRTGTRAKLGRGAERAESARQTPVQSESVPAPQAESVSAPAKSRRRRTARAKTTEAQTGANPEQTAVSVPAVESQAVPSDAVPAPAKTRRRRAVKEKTQDALPGQTPAETAFSEPAPRAVEHPIVTSDGGLLIQVETARAPVPEQAESDRPRRRSRRAVATEVNSETSDAEQPVAETSGRGTRTRAAQPPQASQSSAEQESSETKPRAPRRRAPKLTVPTPSSEQN